VGHKMNFPGRKRSQRWVREGRHLYGADTQHIRFPDIPLVAHRQLGVPSQSKVGDRAGLEVCEECVPFFRVAEG
jgi:hypothetical protein